MPKATSATKRLYSAEYTLRTPAKTKAESLKAATNYVKAAEYAKWVLRQEHSSTCTDNPEWMALYSTLQVFGVDVDAIVEPFGDNVLKPVQHDVCDSDDDIPLAERFQFKSKTSADLRMEPELDAAVPKPATKPRAPRKTASKAASKPAPKKEASPPTVRASCNMAYAVRPKPNGPVVLLQDGNPVEDKLEMVPVTAKEETDVLLSEIAAMNPEEKAEYNKVLEKLAEKHKSSSDDEEEFLPDQFKTVANDEDLQF
jgi:hypothetical protein